ncbi:V-type ATP synthase subunit D [Clostridium tagluense]|uniref:V-type ATP synthase subunit D n=1 Tax=Clostridium TaxID=1485 RepID=UPI0013E90779|nr:MULTISPECIES: V-type ATP synthase subunit D [Clostridium]MBU3128433.1 V-type ATP synthase subunit D [Clostridium tagluense]MBW9155061.1 V-type ATP synthase subunit D [Clostridium tagluense]MBZ9624673.1 V-type ATP synthase subunit D [Clostridium sp. FP2]MCB2313207.1 V-type ATP synthase subunit D [Clostridium tagluense]MCB2317973.1 V-type ATP synthase subunit D [Clostridium tagluense]
METFAPTKSTLMAAKSSLEFSEKGFELLDKKRNVLIREMMSYVDKARVLQNQVNMTFSKAYKALESANINSGIIKMEDIAISVEEAKDYEILFKSVMGVEVPKIIFDRKEIEPKYGFYRSSASIDEAMKEFNNVKYLTYELAEVENAVYRLAMEVKKTQKRANALQNIQIPKFEEIVKFVTEVLEEKEREDFFRLKVVKKKHRKED